MPPLSCLGCTQVALFLCMKCGLCAACCVTTCGDTPGRLVSTESKEGVERYRTTLREKVRERKGGTA